MALEEKERIIIPDENGEEHLFEVLFTFDVDQTQESYVAVVPAEQKEDEEVEVFAFRYEEKENDDDLALYHIESDDEWDMVEEVLNTVAENDLTE
ncbi:MULTISPECIES: DUF1292 domain-containing protein [Gracilibacillus]|jgi:uncharacterized protein YrzB (UPF0473 family)|uniref:UPF0473 protein GH885_08100 n=1 Tax=Gracilibacillus thailandensis TaxID=563735 RepID=A0A6N7QZZ7_9BACI|nr:MULTISPECIES: DUF1292 domain-containing protein [Gracilibacillus]MRI66310.1 DUF1292 domain-containing protein [Gracilibacillus thailandensis]